MAFNTVRWQAIRAYLVDILIHLDRILEDEASTDQDRGVAAKIRVALLPAIAALDEVAN